MRNMRGHQRHLQEQSDCFRRRDGVREIIDAIMVLKGLLCRFQVLTLDSEVILNDASIISQSVVANAPIRWEVE